MAESLKNFLSPALIQRIAQDLTRVWPPFPADSFVAQATEGLEGLELLDRGRFVAGALDRVLPADPGGLRILISSFGPELSGTEGAGMEPFYYLPHSSLIGMRGPRNPELGWGANHALTRRFTAEFSLRSLLDQDPEGSIPRLLAWAVDPNPHVRRAASEASRPRLPWAPRLKFFPKYPHDTLKILMLLRDDPERYVQRSVANHLNDIGKGTPDFLLEICHDWRRDAPESRLWLLRHALRDRVKKGDPQALALLGAQGGEELLAQGLLRPTRLQIGEKFQVEVEIYNPGDHAVQAEVDLRVHFIKANGKSAPKVFKGAQLQLGPKERQSFRKSISMAVHSTRRPYPGTHRVEAQINGRILPIGVVELQDTHSAT